MPADFILPPAGFGPGSQTDPTGDAGPDYMPMPQDMRTFAPRLPEITEDEALPDLLALLEDVAAACDRVARGAAPERIDLAGLGPVPRRLLAETLGEGEVGVKIRTVPAIAAQESVFAGVWTLRGARLDAIDIAPIPQEANAPIAPQIPAIPGGPARGPGVMNAPALLSELEEKSATLPPADEPHVINLSLLPHTEQDLDWLTRACGTGAVDILSRGYGNCRATRTGLDRVWRVQFFNSMDTLILDTFEVTAMPEVALAAPEDLADSARRLREVMGALA